MKFSFYRREDDTGGAWRRLVLVEPHSVSVDGFTFTIPSGFLSDGATVPQWLWSVFGSPFGDWAEAAVAHDYLYEAQITSRKRADRIFLYLMRAHRIPTWRRNLMYLAVRAFGGKGWRIRGVLKSG